MPTRLPITAALLLVAHLDIPRVFAQSPAGAAASVMVVINDKSALSRSIGEYYALRREIPAKNLCHIRTSEEEEIQRPVYDREIAGPIAGCLRRGGLTEQILYIVTTGGVPLKIQGSEGLGGDLAAVDSELTLLYTDMHQGRPHTLNGMVPNPFFGKRDARFTHPEFPIYLVTRLAAYDFDGVRAIIDRAKEAANRGKFVIDTKSPLDVAGDDWLRSAAILLPKDRVVFDSSTNVVYDQTDVIGYAGWGSNDNNRHRRFLGFKWLPGAIATEFVSTDARTFKRPPADWTLSDWSSPKLWFAGSPQTMTADFLLEGATGASGHVYEPYLNLTPRPQFVLPAYYQGRNLAESFYLGVPGLSWQNVVIGDPLCSLGSPGR
jgi:uncharacterized protein (TIGR03790 family)